MIRVLFLLFSLSVLKGDTIANCRYEDFIGQWKIHVTEYSEDCESSSKTSLIKESLVQFTYPNIIKHPDGIEGKWTMIYNQGSEAVINNRNYLLMSWYNSTHYSCQKTISHWTYGTRSKDWYCAHAIKVGVPITYHKKKPGHSNSKQFLRNSFENFKRNQPRQVLTLEMKEKLKQLPDSFDWRKVSHPSGKSYVSPVRNQGYCGSCYAFASAAAAESRLRIVTNMTDVSIFSPQDIIDCSKYSQGCDGGFPYLVAGKYAQDFGLVTEECNPYQGTVTGTCSTPIGCKRYYFTNYGYIGGYDGATNEELMKLELVENGPFPVSIMAYNDLKTYKSGVYQHRANVEVNEFDPFVETNHVVVIVGYGVEESTGLPYWTIKNSWSETWGMKGFGNILRGKDEIAIESLAVKFNVVYF